MLANTFKPSDIHWQDYDVIYYTGGHGVMWDFLDNPELQEITKNIYEKGGIVSSVCHGYCGLLHVRLSNGKRLIEGKKLTGFAWSEEVLAGVAKKCRTMPKSSLKNMALVMKRLLFLLRRMSFKMAI